eukprot:TRINITY_DN3178_c0_g1_i12.p1 TRINITY_DN3178_c0_g1~~TRINITY_DN3178_c0_g1_i12.p1  ORF type:complete len:250 (+),score=22.60 TRINITY_DN3178_c0_g1_i12:63-812(+)
MGDVGIIPACAGVQVQCGDTVVLGSGSLPEHRGHSAIVTQVSDTHCTAVVLSEDGNSVVGECWPYFCDVSMQKCIGRLGTRVTIEGLSGSRIAWCNGLTGRVSVHPQQGHPCFIRKKREPFVVFCITLENPPQGAPEQVLIKPQYLVAYVDVVSKMLNDLTMLAPKSEVVCASEKSTVMEAVNTIVTRVDHARADVGCRSSQRARLPATLYPIASINCFSLFCFRRGQFNEKRGFRTVGHKVTQDDFTE